jgi:hypothetical protein
MGLKAETIKRMDQLVKELIADFGHFVEVFDEARRFSGPSLYFHYRTLERLREHRSASDALRDDSFIESLYATLAAWGMHRMGTTGAQMVDFDDFKRSLLSQVSSIKVLEEFGSQQVPSDQVTKLSTVPTEEGPTLVQKIWAVIDGLNISRANVKTVIGAKALHHLLPELVPPIDRRYTLRFFLNRMNFPKNEFDAFEKIFERLHRIAIACARPIESLLATRTASGEPYGYMRTSATKMIDNAVVGYGIERLRIKEREEQEE